VAVLLAALVIFLVFDAGRPVLAGEDTTHIVKPGETLSAIAHRYGLSWPALARYNNISTPNLVRPGQVVRIPSAVVSPATQKRETMAAPPPTALRITPAPTIPTRQTLALRPTQAARHPGADTRRTIRVHVIRGRESLTSIAIFYGTSVTAIKARNGLTRDVIYRGQRLIIPSP